MKKNLWSRAFQPVDPEAEMEYEEYSDQPYEEPSFTGGRSKVINMPESRQTVDAQMNMNMVIFCPTNYEQTQSLIDNLKERKPVIVNLDEIDVAVAQRILDFISGAVYALGGDVKKVARNIFVVVPYNVSISTNVDEHTSYAYEDYYEETEPEY